MTSLVPQLDLSTVSEWIARFNLFGLPFVIALVLFWAGRKAGRTGVVDHELDRQRAVRWIGLLNFGLALRDVLVVVPALKTHAETGGFDGDPLSNVFLPAIAIFVHTIVGLGVRRLKRWARWAEVVFHLLVIVFIALAAWFATYGASIDPGDWPDKVLWYVIPFLITFVMFLPGTGRVFRAGYRRIEGSPPRMSALSMVILAFLVILGASLVTNALYLSMIFASGTMQGSGV